MEIAKFRAQLSIASELAAVGRQRAENTLARWRESLQKARTKSESHLRVLRAASNDAIAFASERISRFEFQLSSASKRLAAPLEQAQNTVSSLGSGAVDTVRKMGLEARNDLLKLQSVSRDAVAFAGGQMVKAGSHVFVATKQVEARMHLAHSSVATLVKTVVEKPRRLRDARRAKEDELRHLLSLSLDAMVVTDVKRRLVDANPKALELFGISEFNMQYFTIDTFIAHYEALDDASASSVSNQVQIHGRCRIRRLDGALRVAECHFVPEVVPRRHLYEFLNIAPYKITPFGFAMRNALARRTVEAQCLR